MSDKRYHRIYLSPHLDDAALSCGGRIFLERQAGWSILVVTIMAGDPPTEEAGGPFVTELHRRWGLDAHANPVAVRRTEDQAAMSVLDVQGWHWRWPDCIYRRHAKTGEFLYRSEADLFGSVHPAEKTLIEELARHLDDLPLAAVGNIYVPLTVGGHIDHQLVRRAAETTALSDRLIYYEDYPYAEKPETLTTRLGDGNWWRAHIVPLSQKAMQTKSAAVACYRSQLGTFFANEVEMARRLRAYAATVGAEQGWAERYWYRKQDPDTG